MRRGDVSEPPLGPVPSARSRSEWVLWLLAGGLLAVMLTWPLVRTLSTTVPQDLGDPLAQAWSLSWGGNALLARPGDLFQGNVFWPSSNSYAYTDTLLGYAPAAILGEGSVAAVVRYNLVLLAAYALAFAGAALLARELGCRPAAAAVAGVAYAWAPWRMTHNGHLNVLSTGGVALALFLLVSGYRRGRPGQVLAGWAVAAWQLSLGFALGIWFAYLLAVLAALTGVTWWWRGRPGVPRSLSVASGVGAVLVLATSALMARPYLQIVSDDEGALRGQEEVAFFSPPVRSLLAAAAENRAWGEATAFVRDSLPWPPEQALFPGVLAVLLALVGLGWRGASPGLRGGLLVGSGLTLLLSFGLSLWGGLLYLPLYEYAPGWDGLRTPGRLAFVWTLGVALLAGMGGQRVDDAVRRRSGPVSTATSSRVAVGVVLALGAVVVYEGAPRLPLAQVPVAPTALAVVQAPLLHLPSDALTDSRFMLWSTNGFRPVGNGSSGYTPPVLSALRSQTAGFPDARSVQFLRQLGFRSVVVHRDLIAGTPWDGASDRSVGGLGITRTDRSQVVVFDLTR